MRRLLSGSKLFASVHILNNGLNLAYSLAQTIVFAKVLDPQIFSKSIWIVTVGLYLSLVNSAVARANFVVIRDRLASSGSVDDVGEATAAFHLEQALMLGVALLAPVPISSDWSEYVQFFCLCLYFNLSNAWVGSIQTMFIAVDRPTPFALVTVVRRILVAACLVILLFKRDFLSFCVSLLVLSIVFHAAIIFWPGRRPNLFWPPAKVGRARTRTHIHRTLLSAQATLAEWLSLNAPYMIFSARFGVGPALVVLDTGMKLLRVVLSVTRMLSEIVVARISTALHADDLPRARQIVLAVLGLSIGAAIPVAVALWLQGPLIFELLLSSNNVVPAAAGAPFAVAVLAGVAFQLGSHLVSHLGGKLDIGLFSVVALASSVAFGVAVWLGQLSLMGAVWAFTATFCVAALGSAAGLVRLLWFAGGTKEPSTSIKA